MNTRTSTWIDHPKWKDGRVFNLEITRTGPIEDENDPTWAEDGGEGATFDWTLMEGMEVMATGTAGNVGEVHEAARAEVFTETYTVPFFFAGAECPTMIEMGEGGRIETGGGGPTEEGWHRFGRVVEMSWGVVTLEEFTDGTDCDGRLSTEHEFIWNPTEEKWVLKDRSQRDYSAEAMGY